MHTSEKQPFRQVRLCNEHVVVGIYVPALLTQQAALQGKAPSSTVISATSDEVDGNDFFDNI